MKQENFFTRLFSGKSKAIDEQALRSELIGWHETGKVNTLSFYKGNQYENGYGSIQAITKQFFNTIPYAIDAKGKRLKQTTITDVLAHPNKDMSGLDFREALSLMSLVHNKVYIRVWHTGNKVNERTIKGFTFLEGIHEFEDEKGTVYQTPQGESLREDEVIVLKNINPYDLNEGYSVANAVRRWANIDDYIAAYQSGFFENGAVPSGMMKVTAPSANEYQDIVHNLKSNHRGAGKNDNVVYSYAPLDPMTGKPSEGSLTWVPFNTTNKDLALQEIFNQVNKKIDAAYGVPPSVRGDNSNNTWASVRVDQEIFIDNAVRPFANKIWTRFTHELNRITGGLGYALVVDIETPHIAEEDKAFAETQKTSTETLLSLLDKGFTLESAVKALELDESFLALKQEEKPVIEEPEEVNEDTTTVDEGEEVEDAPEEDDKSKTLEPLTVNCKHCGRYLFKATGTTVVEDMPCPKCKATLNFKIISDLGNEATHKFTYVEQEPTDWKMVARSKQLSEEEVALTTDKIEKAIRSMMERQIDRIDVEKKALDPLDAADADLYAQEVLSIVTPLMTAEGMKQFILSRTITGIDPTELSAFSLDETQVKRYRKYLTGVAKGYSEDTEKHIKEVLKDGIENKLPAQEVKKNLANIMNTDEWRVKRLALTETNRAGNTGSIYAMEQVQKEAKVKINKVWVAQGGACEYCRALDGKSVGVDEVFVEKDGEIEGADGGKMKNTFGHMDVPTAHPNCSCYTTYKVVK